MPTCTFLHDGLSEPEFYGDLFYKFKKFIGRNDVYFQFRKNITRYRRIGYNLNVMRQPACLVFNPIVFDNYVAFFNCTPVGRASDCMMAPTESYSFKLVGPDIHVCCLAHWVSTGVFFCSGFQLVILRPRIFRVGQLNMFSHQGGYHDLFVCP